MYNPFFKASTLIQNEHNCRETDYSTIIPEPTARSAVPGVSPGRGLLIVHKRSSKPLFMGDGDEIFLVSHDVMLTLISTIWRTIMNG